MKISMTIPFPTNQQMPDCATTEKNWLLSQIQNHLKSMKLAHSKNQYVTELTYHLRYSSTSKKKSLIV